MQTDDMIERADSSLEVVIALHQRPDGARLADLLSAAQLRPRRVEDHNSPTEKPCVQRVGTWAQQQQNQRIQRYVYSPDGTAS